MARWRGGGAIALAFLLAACTGSDDAESTPTVALPASAADVAVPNHLVVLDRDGEVLTLEPDGSGVEALTDDAGTVRHWQPLWSPDGQSLIWGEQSESQSALALYRDGEVSRYRLPSIPFFSMWSPDGSRVGLLHASSSGSLDFRILDIDAGLVDVAGAGGPFYFSWSPDGTRLAAHVGASRLSILETDGLRLLAETQSDFQAPAWTPNGIVSLSGGRVIVGDPDGESIPVAEVTGPATIVASPDGSRLAVQVIGPDDGVQAALQTLPNLPRNVVVVLDTATGEFQVASSRTSLGFFWSPDGTRLLTLVASQQEGYLEWQVWHDGDTEARVSFIPLPSLLRDLLPFFDQYAQAWSPWSPDSTAFAFAGVYGEVPGVWIQDLGVGEPEFLIEGSWVAWSGA